MIVSQVMITNKRKQNLKYKILKIAPKRIKVASLIRLLGVKIDGKVNL